MKSEEFNRLDVFIYSLASILVLVFFFVFFVMEGDKILAGIVISFVMASIASCFISIKVIPKYGFWPWVVGLLFLILSILISGYSYIHSNELKLYVNVFVFFSGVLASLGCTILANMNILKNKN